MLDSGAPATTTYVRFSAAKGIATIERVNIEVLMAAGQQAVSPQNLVNVVKTTLGQSPVGSSTVAEGVLLLRDSIKQRLKPSDITFFLEGSASPIRVSELSPPAKRVSTE